VKEALFKLKGLLENVEATEIRAKDCKAFFPNYKFQNGKKFSLNFLPPKSVSVIGSLLSDCVCNSQLNFDLFVQIPSQCLQKEDKKEFRYHDKRVLYMSVLAAKLAQKKGYSVTVENCFSTGNATKKPILSVLVKNKFTVKILVGFSSQHKQIVYSKLLPHVDR
jgi:hypothetical protein